MTHHAQRPKSCRRGFTLIELSIVLVIIGLLVGGVLVGRDLIKAAEIRATVSQIEKYNTTVHTFELKYNCLPGDCLNAGNFGFAPRASWAGGGDGNGIIEGLRAAQDGVNGGTYELNGETEMFWVDLSTANLIGGGFSIVNLGNDQSSYTGASINNFMPTAKLGSGNNIYVYSNNGLNYYGLSAVTSLTPNVMGSNPGLNEQQAYQIDTKIDDGLPQSGSVTAQYINYGVVFGVAWASGNPLEVPPSGTSARAGAATTCYDNGGINGATQHYSTEVSGGTGINCALSFRFQ